MTPNWHSELIISPLSIASFSMFVLIHIQITRRPLTWKKRLQSQPIAIIKFMIHHRMHNFNFNAVLWSALHSSPKIDSENGKSFDLIAKHRSNIYENFVGRRKVHWTRDEKGWKYWCWGMQFSNDGAKFHLVHKFIPILIHSKVLFRIKNCELFL